MASQNDVRYSITAEDRFSSTFSALKRDLAGAQGALVGMAGAAGRAITSLGGVATVSAAIGAGGLAFKRLANELDALNDSADATGGTVETLSALEEVARRNGGSLDLVTSSIVKMNQALNAATPDSSVAKALAAIGLTAKDLKSQDPGIALQTLARALSGYADDGNKARLVQELFGKSLREAAPFLKDLADAGELNAKVTSEQAAQAEKFNKQLYALSTAASNAGRTVVSDLLPTINRLFDELAGGGGANGGSLGKALTVPLETAAVLGANVSFVLRGIGTEIGGMAAQAAAFLSGDFKGAASIGESMRADAVRARKEFDALERRLLGIKDTAAGITSATDLRRLDNAMAPKPSVGGGGSGGGGKPTQQTEAERYLETLQRQNEKMLELTSVQQLQADIEARRISGINPQIETRLRLEAALVDVRKRVNKENEIEAGFQKLVTDKLQRDINDGLGLLENTPTGQRERIDRQVDLVLNVQRQNPMDETTNRKAGEALARLRAELDELNKPIEAATDGVTRLQDTIEKSMDRATNAVLDFVVEGKGGFGDLFKAFERDLLRETIEDPLRDVMKSAVRAIRKELEGLSDNLMESIVSIFKDLTGGGGGGGGGFLDTIFSFFGSTSRANGGPVKANQVVRWQENGKEWFVPGSDGTVLNPSQQRALGGGGSTVNYSPVFNVNGDVSPQTVAAMKSVSEAQLARLMRSMRTGGAFA